ncbi:MAG: hypothetical protein WC661_01575 [Opitutaceae bacterium]|jgi:hypothetical protein
MRDDLPLLPSADIFANPQPTPDDGSRAVDALIHERPRILRIKLAVLATQIQERLSVRANNLAKIERSLVEASARLADLEEARFHRVTPVIIPEVFWMERQAQLDTEVRSADVECWRDVSSVMGEFLTTWEALEQSQARANFLRDQSLEDAS